MSARLRRGRFAGNCWQPTAQGQPTGLFLGGWSGAFKTLPFAIWFFLAIEQLPLAAEEAHDVVNDMPKALIAGIATLIVFSLFTLVLNSGVGNGAVALGSSDAPLGDGFEAVFGISPQGKFFTLLALTGLVASFHTIIYAYGRVLFALSRAGYIPRVISLTGKSHTPWVALIAGAVVGLGCAMTLQLVGGGASAVGEALINMAVFGAVLSYVMVMVAYIKLRISRPKMKRPYRSPLGIPGALTGAALALLALAATFTVREYRLAIWLVATFSCRRHRLFLYI